MGIADYLMNLITVTSAAKLKDVRRQDIYYHIKKKRLTVIEIDKVKFVLRDEVEQLEVRKSNTAKVLDKVGGI